ncbi:Uncharacterized protein FWK35_00027245 [Aphis craccivora]|uniref:Uncharacterized protein n=1 Tax=Aphis craccivora TaxID=307492 RepID=A0A6G0VZ22_APHCR|nr:Uncharacterized protein FWK35_00027245 [Aphis craccivora]
MLENTFVMSSSFDDVNSQKFAGNDINPVKTSIGIWPLPSASSCLENSAAYGSFCNSTLMFVVNFNFLTCRHKNDNFRHALISSATVDSE